MVKIPHIFLPALIVATGCGASTPSALKPESDRVKIGMQPEQVKAICGEPSMNITDPLSGSAMWMYKDPRVGDHMSISFNMDGVSKVVYGTS